MMIKLTGAKKGIEVGTFTGYSALCLALGLPDDGKLICLDVSKEWTDIGKKYWKEAKVDHKIDLRLAPAAETMEDMIKDERNHNAFDFAFLDADKPNYGVYYEQLLVLLKPNGFLIIDNYLWGGSVCEDDINPSDEYTYALRQLAETIKDDDRVERCAIPIADGVAIIRKK